tara:strand:- start:1137 stop:1769 length:633 start_codon:yes stop_codon:yes gene_type:complete
MKNFKLFILLLITITGFNSCSENEDTMTLLPVQTKQITNLHAPQSGGQGQPVSGDFVKFNFTTGETTIDNKEWDIAFRGTSIIINGGVSLGTNDEPNRNGEAAVYIASGNMASVTDIDTTSFLQDSQSNYAILTGGGNGWYNYAGPPTHLITPIPGKILVFKTHNGLYAKVEILSYYKNSPSQPDAFIDGTPYYTFNYVYQPNQGVNGFE